jgi:hypothetical protein
MQLAAVQDEGQAQSIPSSGILRAATERVEAAVNGVVELEDAKTLSGMADASAVQVV